MTKHARSRESGFTLLELLVVLAILGIIALLGYPALLNALHRAKVEGAVRQVAAELRAARLEAVKRSEPIYVAAETAAGRVATYRETVRGSGFSPAAEELLRELPLQARVQFWGPADASPNGPDAFAGLPPLHHFTFLPSGAAEVTGAFRLADGKGNFFEVRVAPPATGKVAIRKWKDPSWKAQHEGGEAWQWQ